MKISEEPIEKKQTSLAAAILAAAVRDHQQLALNWQARPEQLKAVRDFLQHFDCPLVEDPAQSRLQFLLPSAALAPLARAIQQAWPADAELIDSLKRVHTAHRIIWRAGRHTFDLNERGIVYGILNVTPDSFYDGGQYNTTQTMEDQAQRMVEAGADVVEVGGQTTRPGGFHEISPAEEIARIKPAIEFLQKNFPQVALAVDTYKLPVMEFALDAGVDIINDVQGFDTPEKRQLLAHSRAGLVTMHSNRTSEYDNLTTEMIRFFEQNVAQLVDAGIDRNRICLDQGIGYAKVADGDQDLAMMHNIAQLNRFRLPLLVAISRKGFGKKLFGLAKQDRLPVTLIAESAMYFGGGRVIRAHDVQETKQLVELLKRIEEAYWYKPAGQQD
ncbi:dihydropteroate synthase [Limosilactobacillus kribbianus]|uniref:dihydropteroate synthase n=1 Tax=Limosilactobacillus kribbianus TaxID=2982695 RepID=UPI00226489BD|nr:dihydropteroate synthase [Limosilactobacillus kribbianus]